MTTPTTPEGRAKSLGEKLFEAFGNEGWDNRSADNQAMYERYALAFATSLTHDETANAVIASLRAALEEAEGREKNHGVARFVDAEEIAELMEAGARTWMPMELARPERNGSIIVMTSDDAPVIGQAFWHEHGDGTWALHWSAVSPKEDCWNDPITETNKGLACWQPMPEGPCEARVKAMGSPIPHMAALLRIKALEDALRKIAEGNLGDRAWEANYAAIREVARAALTTKSGEASE